MRAVSEVLCDWEAVIGLEVHCALTTLQTKMFCGCKLEFGAPPNTHTCPVCLGLPGALPVPNKAAIESIVLAGLATNCDIMRRSLFYRKGYLYPDMPKGFQITQGPVAFCMNGFLDLHVDGPGAEERPDPPDAPQADGGYVARIGIERIHLEEDAGKMIHVGGDGGRIAGATHSLVDYNRAGTPLIELVTRPDLRTPEEARLFLQKLRRVFVALGISDCSMEKGSLRADGNISLRRRGSDGLGVKTELKNINSFKHLHDGLAYEICRQAAVLESGGAIRQETRHWDPVSKHTIVMRVKETADDYRMFPDPDLAPYDLSDEFVARVRAKLPELPDQKAKRFMADYGLPDADARILATRVGLTGFFEAGMAIAGDSARMFAKPLANLLVNDVPAAVGTDGSFDLAASPLTPARAIELVRLLVDGSISSRQGKEVLAAVLRDDEDPAVIVAARGMAQVSDIAVIESVVDAVLAANAGQVARYRDGKRGLIGYFVGQCMKATDGRGNPRLINEVLARKLDEQPPAHPVS
ncbi:MAG: Asp-tRNA(Asn)/Glu-tRNA(Gln) amidotransferase subunit GatB [Coriobacteriaceae bacterium]|nr:Asp-tRNA(Asn)/Glu-tRNA(Gln) amidotransferase subunit GatB [Coriobacteriaceae bacterium]